MYVYERGVSPFRVAFEGQWLFRDADFPLCLRLGNGELSALPCSQSRSRPRHLPKAPRADTATHHRRIRDTNTEPAAHAAAPRPSPPRHLTATLGTGPPHRKPDPLWSLSCPRPSARRGPPVPPLMRAGTACQDLSVSCRTQSGLGRSASSLAMKTERRWPAFPGRRPSGLCPLPLQPCPI